MKKYILPVFVAGLLSSPFFFYNRWQDVDFWGHLSFGKQIVETRTIPKTDFYSYTAYGNKWINHEWLSEVILYTAYKIWQDRGLIFLKLLVGFGAGCFLFSTLLIYSKNYKIIFTVYLLSLSLIFPGTSFRPQIFTYLCLSATGFLLHSYVKTADKKLLYFLTPIITLWANMHGGFAAGILLVILFLTAAPSLKNLFFAFVIAAGTIINPYGINLWKTIFTALTNPLTTKYIAEWGTFKAGDFSIFGYIFIFMAAISALSSIIFLSQKRYVIFSIIIASIFLAFRSARHIPVFAIITAPFLIPYFQNIRKRFTQIFVTAFALLPLFLVLFLSIKNPELKISAENKFPAGAVKFIKDVKLRGNIFNEFDWGEYIIWNLYPACKVAIDGRYDTVYSATYLKNYFENFHIPEKTDFLLLRPGREIDNDNWHKIYGDDISVLYSKKP